MDDLLADAASRAIQYLRAGHDAPVYPSESAVDALSAFREPLPPGPTDPAQVIEQLAELGGPGTVRSTGGRYLGFVTGGAHPVGVAAAWLAAAWDQNAALSVMSPTAAALDRVAGEWLADLFGLPDGTQHSFLTGTSVANATCLAAGRDRLLHDMGWDSVDQGLRGAPPLRVVLSAEAHSSVRKALGFIGIGRSNVVVAPVDGQGRLDPRRLPPAGPPTLVILQAGNVNSGACDRVDAVADHFGDSPRWIHVDGAFGLWAAAAPSRRHLVAGLGRADSWATDMHKWLNVTYDSAVAFVRQPADLARTFRVGAAYAAGGGAVLEPMERTPDMSQRARAVETWAVLKALGRSGVADLVERTCDYAVQLARRLASAGFQVHNDVVLNQVLVSLGTDEATMALQRGLAATGELWAGGSTWHDRAVLRLSVSSHATRQADIDRIVQTLARLAAPPAR